MYQRWVKCRSMVTTIVGDPTPNDRVEHPRQVIDSFVDTTAELPGSNGLTDRFGGLIADARTEVDEGLAPSVHRQSRPERVTEKVELLDRVVPSSDIVLAIHDLCLAWM